MSTIHERLQTLVDSLAKGNQSEFARTLGITQSTLNTYLKRSEPGYGILYKIAVAYPTLRMDWLITGAGAMFRQPPAGQTNSIAGNVGNVAGRDINLWQEVQHLKERLHDKEQIISLLTK
jgi:transcriptional regulator with XRE-family HTH domain